MLIISFTGDSETGKTTIITRLTEELKKRGYKVGCIKHCPNGFDLDHPGKDSYQFMESGAYGVVLHSPDRVGLVKFTDGTVELKELAADHFMDADFVLAEGFKEAKEIKKIELLRKGVCEKPKLKDAIAIFAGFDIKTKKLVFHPDDIKGIVNFLEKMREKEERIIKVKVNDEDLPLKPIIRSIIRNTIAGLTEPLKRKDKIIKRIDINMEV